MKRNLACGFAAVFVLGVSAVTVAGKTTRICAGAACPASGPVKFIRVGGIFVNKKQAKKSVPVAAKPVTPSLNSEFRLGEVYVSPNPAKGGEAPVFHIETGIADSVNIQIHTVSGMLAHERTITGMPKVFDKAGSPAYAYEYAWEGLIAPGIYYYAIEAAKSGKNLTKSGMFVVIK